MSITSFTPLITAEDAYPAMERAVLDAEKIIVAGFRVFDLDTKLRSDEAREIGETWQDLLRHKALQGVKLDFAISDFDPILAFDLHHATGKTLDRFKAIATETGGPVEARASMHPARVGRALQFVFWPMVLYQAAKHVRRINAMSPDERAEMIRILPRLKHFCIIRPDGRLRLRWRPPHLYPATHHQKLMLIDETQLIIGGLDLDERRWDRKDHTRAPEQTWQDVSVHVKGDVVEAALKHLRGFEEQIPEELNHPDFFRTLSREVEGKRAVFSLSPVTLDNGAEEAHLDLIAGAQRLIYIETQFLRHQPIADALVRAAREKPGLEAIIVLPAAPEDAAFEKARGLAVRYGEYLQAKAVNKLLDAFGDRIAIISPAQPTGAPRDKDDGRAHLKNAPIIYVHSKVAIADDQIALVSSANLNGRSLRWDTEAGVILRDPARCHALRLSLFAHLLPEDADPRCFDIETACAAWRDLATENLNAPPTTRRGFLLPYDRKPARRIGLDVVGIPREMV